MDNPINTIKKTIYLDQFAISGLTKILDPTFSRRDHILEKEPFWLDLYKKIDRLLRLQLIVCPASSHHRTESLVSTEPSFESLQAVYTYLSNDCTFFDEGTILQSQLRYHFYYYLHGEKEREPEIPVGDLVSGHLNEWQDHIRVLVPHRLEQGEAEKIRTRREQLHKRLETAFELWQQEAFKHQSAVEGEARSLALAVLDAFFSRASRVLAHLVHGEPLESYLDILPPPIIRDMIRILEEDGIADVKQQLEHIGEYLLSSHILRIPFVRLSSMLYAALARKAPSKASPPNRGTFTDVTVISSLLPYCDAMFLDNEMAGHLRENPLHKEVLHFKTRIFSPRTRSDLLNYLDEIESQASGKHLKWVKMFYPPWWFEPYMGVVTQGQQRGGDGSA